MSDRINHKDVEVVLTRRVRGRGQYNVPSKVPEFEGFNALKSQQGGHLAAMVNVMGHDSPDGPLP
jgi:hypothetical protein